MTFEFAIIATKKAKHIPSDVSRDGLTIVSRYSPVEAWAPFLTGIPTLDDAVQAVMLLMEGVEWLSPTSGWYERGRRIMPPRTQEQLDALNLAAPGVMLPGEDVPRWKRPGTLG
jgi:hypothetical protein